MAEGSCAEGLVCPMKVAIAKMKCGRKGGAGAASFQIVLEKKKTNQ